MPLVAERSTKEHNAGSGTSLPDAVNLEGLLRQSRSIPTQLRPVMNNIDAEGSQENELWFWAPIVAATIPFCFQSNLPASTWIIFYLTAAATFACLLKAEGKIARQSEHKLDRNSLWYGFSGVFVMLFGVFFQFAYSVILVLSSTHMFHAVLDTLVVISLVVPFGNFLSWQAIRQNRKSLPNLRRFISGLSCFCQIACFAYANLLWSPLCVWVSLFTVPFLIITLRLSHKIWSQQSPENSKKEKVVVASAVGIAAAFCLLPAYDKLGDSLAAFALTFPEAQIRSHAFEKLQNDDAAESLLASASPNCSSLSPQKALPISPALGADAFYRLTGSPVCAVPDDRGGMEDAFYTVPGIGPKSLFLNLSKSSLNSSFDSKNLSARFDWSFTFNNSGCGPGKEARLRIMLPPGAAVSSLKLFSPPTGPHTPAPAWQQNVPATVAESSTVGAFTALQKTYAAEAERLKDPVLVSALEGSTILLQAAPVLHGAPIKVQLSMVAPVSVPQKNSKSLEAPLPRIIDSNLSSLVSPNYKLSPDSSIVRENGVDTAVSFRMNQPVELESRPIYRFSSASGEETLVQRRLSSKPAHFPERLVIALDGSAGNLRAGKNLAAAVKMLPPGFVSKLVLADPLRGIEVYDSSVALFAINTTVYQGGDNNWDLLAAAVNVARKEKADVLWVHASKPWAEVSSAESWPTKYPNNPQCPHDIAGLCNNSVKVYDFQGEQGMNEIVERIHASGGDLSPFIPVELRDGQVELKELFAAWTSSDKTEKRFEYDVVPSLAGSVKVEAESNDDSLLIARQHEVELLAAEGKRNAAEALALKYQALSPYTGRMCSNAIPDTDPAVPALKHQRRRFPTIAQPLPVQQPHVSMPHVSMPNVSMPKHRHHHHRRTTGGGAGANANATTRSGLLGDGRLQGASSGTIPGMTGVINTTGTVRVNNLAVAESVLNFVANGIEIIFLAWGVPSAVVGLLQLNTRSGRLRAWLGVVFAVIGLSVPGLVNWLVASTRDGGGFS